MERISIDHVHLRAIQPKLSISTFMGYLKGKSMLMIYGRNPELQSKWDKAFWQEDIMLKQLVISQMRQFRNI